MHSPLLEISFLDSASSSDIKVDDFSPKKVPNLTIPSENKCEYSKSSVKYDGTIKPFTEKIQLMINELSQKICQDLGHEFTISLESNIRITIDNGYKHRILMTMYQDGKCESSTECKTPLIDVDII